MVSCNEDTQEVIATKIWLINSKIKPCVLTSQFESGYGVLGQGWRYK
ncbi:hypothetical protein HanXRQr2_Chr07g0309331 [Helianthus annuus]|uniref:Uncharacterized protein n=1 Tax=Helianthus annuus TaxID=4232 RepID=A0A9K3INK9_HELAN|nr:hypothetical protein HanXRQr2_Chr07g0309331 [Helianthus annuus]